MISYWLKSQFPYLLAAAYVIALVASYLYYGMVFQFTLGVASLILLPFPLLLGQARRYLRDWTPFLVLLLSYEALQGLAAAYASARGVVSLYPLDRALWGTNLTGLIQSTFLSQNLTWLTTLLYSLHLPLVALTAAILWYYSKAHFKKYVSALLICSYSSLLVFVLVPTAPPWYLGVAANLVRHSADPDLPSRLANFISYFSSVASTVEADPYAAFPSLHTAYAVLFAYFTTKANRRYGLLSIPIALGIIFSTLYLGQHFLLDLLGGAGVAVGSIAISSKLGQPRELVQGSREELSRAALVKGTQD